jgi:hypothetical protein
MATQRCAGSTADQIVPAGIGGASTIAAACPASLAAADRALIRAARRRPIRVICLVTAVALMSLADLYITIIYLRTVGMGEANPIARYVMEHGSQNMLILWKCASVSLACIIFVKYRSRAIAEAASWFAFAVLIWLLIRWIGYADEVWRLTPALHTLSDAESALWVRLGD